MNFLGDCDKCGKLGLLTRYRTDGVSDYCSQCHADEEYERLMQKKEDSHADLQGV